MTVRGRLPRAVLLAGRNVAVVSVARLMRPAPGGGSAGVCCALAWRRVSGEPPGEEPFGAFGLGEACGHQFTLEHVPRWAVGVAGDLFFADDLVALGDPVQVTSTTCLSVGVEDLRQGCVGVPADLARAEFLQRVRCWRAAIAPGEDQQAGGFQRRCNHRPEPPTV